MTDLKVFYCKNDHIIYSEEKPAMCPECSSTFITVIHGVTVAREMIDGISSESKYNNR